MSDVIQASNKVHNKAQNKSHNNPHNRTVKIMVVLTLIIIGVIITYLWLVNVWQVARFQQALLTNKRSEVIHKKTKPALKLVAINNTLPVVDALTLEKIELPKAPALKTSSSKPVVVEVLTKQAAVLKSKSTAIEEKKIATQSNITMPSKIKNQHKIENTASKPALKATPITNKRLAEQQRKHKINQLAKQKTNQIYTQLSSDQSLSIEIAWPNNAVKRETLFTYLYQCVGMKFGVLSNQRVTLAPQRNNFVANTQAQYSDWLRVAQGRLAQQEKNWLQQYNLVGTAVRLLPKSVDWQLAAFITQQLQNTPLKSLRANYKLAKTGLLLDNIYLNGKAIKNQWQLTQDSC